MATDLHRLLAQAARFTAGMELHKPDTEIFKTKTLVHELALVVAGKLPSSAGFWGRFAARQVQRRKEAEAKVAALEAEIVGLKASIETLESHVDDIGYGDYEY